MPRDILTLRQASSFLQLGRSTLYRLTRSQQIPAAKIAGRWRYSRRQLVEWLENQHRVGSETEPREQ